MAHANTKPLQNPTHKRFPTKPGRKPRYTPQELLLVVREMGGIRRAAAFLGLAAPTISEQLAAVRGTPEYEACIRPNINEIRMGITSYLADRQKKLEQKMDKLDGLKYVVGFGILCDKVARLEPLAVQPNQINIEKLSIFNIIKPQLQKFSDAEMKEVQAEIKSVEVELADSKP